MMLINIQKVNEKEAICDLPFKRHGFLEDQEKYELASVSSSSTNSHVDEFSFDKHLDKLKKSKRSRFESVQCCNLSGGVALIVWFSTNGMCAKNNTIIYVTRASNSKRDCDVVALPILTCERLNMMTSVREERLRRMISIVACCHSVKLCAHTARDFRSQQQHYTILDATARFRKYFPIICIKWKKSAVPQNSVFPGHTTLPSNLSVGCRDCHCFHTNVG